MTAAAIPLRQFLSNQTETYSLMEAAAKDRLVDALALIHESQPHAAVYLGGYVVEMLLKCAYCRVIQHPYALPVKSALNVNRIRVQQLVANFRANVSLPSSESNHSIKYWCEMLDLERQARGLNFAPVFKGQLSATVDRVYDIWWVESRYRFNAGTMTDAQTVFYDAVWVEMNYATLWR